MKWEEVRKIYPNKFVKIQIIDSKTEGNKRCIVDISKAVHESTEPVILTKKWLWRYGCYEL